MGDVIWNAVLWQRLKRLNGIDGIAMDGKRDGNLDDSISKRLTGVVVRSMATAFRRQCLQHWDSPLLLS